MPKNARTPCSPEICRWHSLVCFSRTRRASPLIIIASGDLRNVIKSVNSLPTNYSGKLNIVLNDRNPLVAARNALILSVLAIGDNVVCHPTNHSATRV